MVKKTPINRYVIGVDLGGTKILAAVVSHSGKIISRAKKKTGAGNDAVAIMDRIVKCCREAVKEAKLSIKKIEAIGIGSPGPLDPYRRKNSRNSQLESDGSADRQIYQEKIGL